MTDNNNILTIEEYSGKTGISVDELKGKSRKQTLTIPRFVYWYYLNSSDPVLWSSVKIAELFDREYQAILHGLKQIRNFIDTNDSIIAPYRSDFIEPFLPHQKQYEQNTNAYNRHHNNI